MASVPTSPAARQTGAYESAVRLTGAQKDINLAELVLELHELVGGSAGAGGIAETVLLNTTYGAQNSGDSYLYAPGGTEPLRLIRIPTLEELGFDAATHELEVKPFGHFRADNTPETIDIRLVGSDGNMVGVASAKTVNQVNRDDVLGLDEFIPVSGGELYALDFKKQAANATVVDLSNTVFVVRIKRSAAS